MTLPVIPADFYEFITQWPVIWIIGGLLAVWERGDIRDRLQVRETTRDKSRWDYVICILLGPIALAMMVFISVALTLSEEKEKKEKKKKG
jgi:hypothetical protein